MTQSPVSVAFDGHAAHVHMDDGKVNVLSVAFLSHLNTALDEAEQQDGASVVVLTGRPNCFSAGLDLGVVRSGDPDAWQKLATTFIDTVRRLYLFPMPVVTVSEGHAIAGGMIILATADVRLALESPKARYGFNETRVGVPLGAEPLAIARQLVPPQHQGELLLHGRLVHARDALERGLVDEVLDSGDGLAARSGEIAADLSELDRPAYSATKLALRGPVLQPPE